MQKKSAIYLLNNIDAYRNKILNEGIEMMGDRCPSCEQESLVENGLQTWICLNQQCGDVFNEEELDFDIENED